MRDRNERRETKREGCGKIKRDLDGICGQSADKKFGEAGWVQTR